MRHRQVRHVVHDRIRHYAPRRRGPPGAVHSTTLDGLYWTRSTVQSRFTSRGAGIAALARHVSTRAPLASALWCSVPAAAPRRPRRLGAWPAVHIYARHLQSLTSDLSR